VKWYGASFHNCTWEIKETLESQRYAGMVPMKPATAKLRLFQKRRCEQENLIIHAPPDVLEQLYLRKCQVQLLLWLEDASLQTRALFSSASDKFFLSFCTSSPPPFRKEIQILEQWTVPERVIDVKEDDYDTEYQVKWKGLPYAECTWEAAHLPGMTPLIASFESFRKKQDATCTMMKNMVTDLKFIQPSSISLDKALLTEARSSTFVERWKSASINSEVVDLKPAQNRMVDKLYDAWLAGKGCLLADSNTRNVTAECVHFISKLVYTIKTVPGFVPNFGFCKKYEHTVVTPTGTHVAGSSCPVLLVVPHQNLTWWILELEKWLVPDKFRHVVYVGDAASREIIRTKEWLSPDSKDANKTSADDAAEALPFAFYKFDLVITTPVIIQEDRAILGAVSWSLLAAESPRVCKIEQLCATLKSFSSMSSLLITDNPFASSSFLGLWEMLHFVNPSKYSDNKPFVRLDESLELEATTANPTFASTLPKDDLDAFFASNAGANIDAELVCQHNNSNLKSESNLQMEDTILPMSQVQKQVYKQLVLDGTRSFESTDPMVLLNFLRRLMKTCNCVSGACPSSPVTQWSPKLSLLQTLLTSWKGNESVSCIVCSKYPSTLDSIEGELKKSQCEVIMVDGRLSNDNIESKIRQYNSIVTSSENGAKSVVLLISTGVLEIVKRWVARSTKSALRAGKVVFFEGGWDSQIHIEAMFSCMEATSSHENYRFLMENSVDLKMSDMLGRDMVLNYIEHLVPQPGNGGSVIAASNCLSNQTILNIEGRTTLDVGMLNLQRMVPLERVRHRLLTHFCEFLDDSSSQKVPTPTLVLGRGLHSLPFVFTYSSKLLSPTSKHYLNTSWWGSINKLEKKLI
jgi:hypothetical protein